MSCAVCELLAESEYDLAEQAAALRLELSEALAALHAAREQRLKDKQTIDRQAAALRNMMGLEPPA